MKSTPTSATTPSGGTGSTAGTAAKGGGNDAQFSDLESRLQASLPAAYRAVGLGGRFGRHHHPDQREEGVLVDLRLERHHLRQPRGTNDLCTSSSGAPTCLASGTGLPMASLQALLSPTTVLGALRPAQAQAAAAANGYSVTFSTGSYAGLSANCVNLSGNGASGK